MRLRLYIGFIVGIAALSLSRPLAAQSVPSAVSIENEVLEKYLNDSDYDTTDYSYTHMSKYVPERYGQCDKPAPVVFSWDVWNPWKEMQLERMWQQASAAYRYLLRVYQSRGYLTLSESNSANQI